MGTDTQPETMTTVDNPYWDAVKDHVEQGGSLWGTPTVGGMDRYWKGDHFDTEEWQRNRIDRTDYVKRYSWTIPSPYALAFVVRWSKGRIVDPMAGTGYWSHLLTESGVDVVSYDLAPGTNDWHKGQRLFVPITQADGAEAVQAHPDRTLFLSWPPMSDAGARIVRAYPGDRIIYIGEADGGCTGDEDMFAEFEANWVETASHVPVQWWGLHDVITVYDRKAAA